MKKRKTCWIVLIIVCLGLLEGRDWLASTKAAGFFVSNHRPALLAAGTGEDAPYIAPYVPTPQEVVDRMLQLAEVRDGDVKKQKLILREPRNARPTPLLALGFRGKETLWSLRARLRRHF